MDTLRRCYYRGELYFADLDPVVGHEQGGLRPVLILQNNTGNLHSPTVIITAATHKACKKASMPTHVTLDNIEGLPGQSQFQLETIRTIDKRRLCSYIGKLDPHQMQQIDEALRVSLHLKAKL